MDRENSPHNFGREHSSSETESKDREVLKLDEIRETIIQEIQAKSPVSVKIEKFDLTAVSGSINLDVALNAGLMGGKIKIQGIIDNGDNTINVHDVKVDARSYIKSGIEDSIPKLPDAIRVFLENKFKRKIQRLQINGQDLVVDFEKSSQDKPAADEVLPTVDSPGIPQNNLAESRPDAVEESVETEDMDPLYKDAVRLVVEAGKASTSMLQRQLRLGYGRTARMLDAMQRDGIIGPPDGSKSRTVLKIPDWLNAPAETRPEEHGEPGQAGIPAAAETETTE